MQWFRPLSSRGNPIVDGAFTPVFVGGVGRSGTTVLQALVCTSASANPYIAECSYFADLVAVLPAALGGFEDHAASYFDNRQELSEYHFKLLQGVLVDIWRRLGRQYYLVLKHPPMTKHFNILRQAFPHAMFMVTVRDPRDVIQSRIDVHRKMRPPGAPDPEGELDFFCRDYNDHNALFTEHPEAFGDHLLLVPYDGLVTGAETRRISDFLGVTDIDPERVWQRGVTDVTEYKRKGDPWMTPSYGEPMSIGSVGRYKARMPEEVADYILERCGATARALGLHL